MTDKLYNLDSYIKSFEATIVECRMEGDKYAIRLDRTAFFPEGGGQSSDKGYIGNAFIFDVREIDGEIYHYSKNAEEVNKSVQCSINFDERFEKMQCHSAEHIASGFFHSLYGIENVGFHLGDVEVTFDTSGVVDDDMLLRVEELSNRAVFDNLKIDVLYPKSHELSSLEYRAKLDITDNVRIVNIGDVDSCACCAPHVAYTGEIGFIKFIECKKHRGGSRITMLAGARAYRYMSMVFSAAKSAAELLSSPISDLYEETKRSLSAKADADYRLLIANRKLAASIADSVEATEGNAVIYCPLDDMEGVRTLVNSASHKVGGALVALFGEEGNYKYVLNYSGDDFSVVVKNANAALSGKGGGRAPMAQGSYAASLECVKTYFGCK